MAVFRLNNSFWVDYRLPESSNLHQKTRSDLAACRKTYPEGKEGEANESTKNNADGVDFCIAGYNGIGKVRRGQQPRDVLRRSSGWGEVRFRRRTPTMRYDGYFGGHAYFSSLDRWVSIGWEVRPELDFSEMVKAHQERFNLARAVFGFRA